MCWSAKEETDQGKVFEASLAVLGVDSKRQHILSNGELTIANTHTKTEKIMLLIKGIVARD